MKPSKPHFHSASLTTTYTAPGAHTRTGRTLRRECRLRGWGGRWCPRGSYLGERSRRDRWAMDWHSSAKGRSWTDWGTTSRRMLSFLLPERTTWKSVIGTSKARMLDISAQWKYTEDTAWNTEWTLPWRSPLSPSKCYNTSARYTTQQIGSEPLLVLQGAE